MTFVAAQDPQAHNPILAGLSGAAPSASLVPSVQPASSTSLDLVGSTGLSQGFVQGANLRTGGGWQSAVASGPPPQSMGAGDGSQSAAASGPLSQSMPMQRGEHVGQDSGLSQSMIAMDITVTAEDRLRSAYFHIVEGGCAFANQPDIQVTPTAAPTFDELINASNTDIVNALLSSAGFDVSGNNTYKILGYDRIAGQAPTRNSLELRGALANILLDIVKLGKWSDPQRVTLEGWHGAIMNAVAQCLLDFGDMTMARRALRGEPKSLEMWKEPGPDLLEYLHSKAIEQDASLAIHMSNLHRLDFSRWTHALPVAATRQVQAALGGQPRQIEEWLSGFMEQAIWTWAPLDQGQVQKIAAAWRAMQAKGINLTSLSLLVPFSPTPGFTQIDHITDTWTHPLLMDKWADILASCVILSPPGAMITSGKEAPLHCQRNIAILTLGAPTATPVPVLESWRPTLLSVQAGPILQIDLPMGHKWRIFGLIKSLSMSEIVSIDAPRPSLGSQKEDQRATIQIHFQNSLSDSTFAKEAIRQYLARQLAEFQVICGWADLVQFPAAMILEVTCISAVVLYTGLIVEAVVLGPMAALIRTTSDEECWATQLTRSWTQNPTFTGERVRHRPSKKIRAPFAQIRASAAQIAGAKARKGHDFQAPTRANPKSLQATIHIPLSTTGPVETWLPLLMDQVASKSFIKLSPAGGSHGTDYSQWRPLFDAEGFWSQQVLIQFESEADLRRTHRAISGHRVTVGNIEAAVEMQSDFVNLGVSHPGAAAPPGL